MNFPEWPVTLSQLAPVVLMAVAALLAALPGLALTTLWRSFASLSGLSLVAVTANLLLTDHGSAWQPWLHASTAGLAIGLLVQLLGTVIGVFSSRYLQGEPGQRGYMAALAAVLGFVQLLLLADHWLVLVAAWALVGVALQRLLCFYPERPFARLAAHKKRLADRLADGLLVVAAVLAWGAVGSGSLADLREHLVSGTSSPGLQASAVCLVLAVILRTALLPVHGWLIQVMEAPTPVSALLHAGVVNLGGFVLIRFAPMLEHAPLARYLLVISGLLTALLAGMVMLTRISIKVRLAWSTVAQMGFMVLECGLGLYSLALLHLIGHSLYKAHAFLAASSIVQATRLRQMHGQTQANAWSLWLAPLVAIPVVLGIQYWASPESWPWWWSVILALAWAPMLWLPVSRTDGPVSPVPLAVAGLLAMAGMTVALLLAHTLPLGLEDSPETVPGLLAMAGMGLLYLGLVLMQLAPAWLASWRRWSYAGFYIDESYTRLTLAVWPTGWAPQAREARRPSHHST